MFVSYDMPSNEYHAEKGHYSSSQLKDILESPELFYKKYVTKEIARGENPAFDIGTYFHTAILEPHLLSKECAVFKGRRFGKEYDSFLERHKGKAIITESEKIKAQNCIDAIRKCPISMGYVKLGTPEVSAFCELYIFNDNIYGFKNGTCYKMSYSGWIEVLEKEIQSLNKAIESGEAVKVGVKVRADSIDMNGVSISDLKSASGNVSEEFSIKEKTSGLHYDLSAAFYLDIFTLVLGLPDRVYTDFVWLYASKDLHEKLKVPMGEPWRADRDNVEVGRAKWTKAIIDIAYYSSINWKLEAKKSILRDLSPKDHELIWLNKKHLERIPGKETRLSDLEDIKRQIEINKSSTKENNMKMTGVSYKRTFRLAEFESETIGIDAVLEEGDTVEESLAELKKLVAEQGTGATPTTATSTKKKAETKLEVAKEETKTEAKKEAKTETKKKEEPATKYNPKDDKHRGALGAHFDTKFPGWRKDEGKKAALKEISHKMEGEDFMDSKGNVLKSFIEKVNAEADSLESENDDL